MLQNVYISLPYIVAARTASIARNEITSLSTCATIVICVHYDDYAGASSRLLFHACILSHGRRQLTDRSNENRSIAATSDSRHSSNPARMSARPRGSNTSVTVQTWPGTVQVRPFPRPVHVDRVDRNLPDGRRRNAIRRPPAERGIAGITGSALDVACTVNNAVLDLRSACQFQPRPTSSRHCTTYCTSSNRSRASNSKCKPALECMLSRGFLVLYYSLG